MTDQSRLVVFVTMLALGACPAFGDTFISAEPIPSPDIIGLTNLTKILSVGYRDLELWSERLLSDCQIAQNLIETLSANRAVRTLTRVNTDYGVAAGGFEGVTDPSFVFTIGDSGPGAASAADIFVLDNMLGYVLNQGGTAQFTLPFNPKNPYEFPLDYAVVTFRGYLPGERAGDFFNYLGTIDPALWTGPNAGFTQIELPGASTNNSMLFLIGDVTKQEFTQGLFKAATTTPNAKYSPLEKNGKPTTATAGAAFPFNDWIASPTGQGYLSALTNPSMHLLNELSALRQKHLQAVANLVKAIDQGNVEHYLHNRFKCP